MRTLKGLIFALITTFTLAGCGGGGGGGGDSTATGSGSTPTGSTQTNPLAKYAGTYYACEDNQKRSVSLTVRGNGSLDALLSEDTFTNDKCAGTIIASYRLTEPVVVTYKTKTSATMPPITILPYSDIVDEVTLDGSNIKATLSGSGVSGNCVKYFYTTANGTTNGESCYELAASPTLTLGALYLTADGKYLVDFGRENGVLVPNGIYSRDPSFDYKSLIRD